MKKGFSLLEMLMVIVFVSVAFFSILQLFVTNLSAERETEGSLVAMNLASGRMERLFDTSFTYISSEATAEVAGFRGYFMSVAVTTREANLKDLKVNVSWKVSGTPISYLLNSLRYNY